MSEFKVGDKVKVIMLHGGDPFKVGDVGKITEILSSVGVTFKCGEESYPMYNSQLELVSKETFTISEALKLAIDGHKLTNNAFSDPKRDYLFFDGNDFMFKYSLLEKAVGILTIKDGWYLLEEPKTPFVPQFAKGEFFANTAGDFGKVLDIIESSYLVAFNGRTKIKYKEDQMVKLEESK